MVCKYNRSQVPLKWLCSVTYLFGIGIMESKCDAIHLESVSSTPRGLKDRLPFIPTEEVKKCDGKKDTRIYIVIDSFVYNVTTFASRHPGGPMPFDKFGGKDCTWQVQKIHGKETLDKYGDLRIGWTEGVENPYKKPESPRIIKALQIRPFW